MIGLFARLLAALAPYFFVAVQAQASGPWPDFTTLVEREGAAVVNISTRQARSEGAEELSNLFPLPELDESDPMYEFFRRIIPKLPRGLGPDPDPRSLGSGFIIGADGYIYFSTEVRYGSGQPDGAVIRLEPAGDPQPAPTRNRSN